MLSVTVFFICAFVSLLVAFYTVEAKTFREKTLVTGAAVVPSLLVAVGVNTVPEALIAIKGMVSPWIGVILWQIHIKNKVRANYKELLEAGGREVMEGGIHTAEERGQAVSTP